MRRIDSENIFVSVDLKCGASYSDPPHASPADSTTDIPKRMASASLLAAGGECDEDRTLGNLYNRSEEMHILDIPGRTNMISTWKLGCYSLHVFLLALFDTWRKLPGSLLPR